MKMWLKSFERILMIVIVICFFYCKSRFLIFNVNVWLVRSFVVFIVEC